MERILVVEDDLEYSAFMTKVLKEHGYQVDTISNPVEAIEFLIDKQYDLVLSDLKMKEMDGIRFLRSAKKIQPAIKSIILTGEPDEASELEAVDLNVDLYLAKEKSVNVILRYIRIVLDKVTEIKDNSNNKLYSDTEGIVLDKLKHQVFKNNKEIKLTAIEFKLLQFLLENKEVLLSRDRIIQEIWGTDNVIDERNVDIQLKKLRDKMSIFSITTIRGLGYKWNE